MHRGSNRPTVPPAFDIEKYARDSDSRLETVRPLFNAEEEAPETPHSEVRLATHPKLGALLTDEAWARDNPGAPRVAVGIDRLKRMPLDHHAGFLLSLMDGMTDLETIVELACMPLLSDALRIVRDLCVSGIVEFR